MILRALTAILTLFLLSCAQERSMPEHFDVWGINLSLEQTEVDWNVVFDSTDPDFILLELASDQVSSQLSYQTIREELSKLGIPHGVYYTIDPNTDGKIQARNFINIAKLKQGDFIPILSIEEVHTKQKTTQNISSAITFSKEIERYYGIRPIIHCTSESYNNFLNDEFNSDDYVLWIVDHQGKPIEDIDWHLWQHTNTLSVNGIKGDVSRDVFIGNKFELNKLILR